MNKMAKVGKQSRKQQILQLNAQINKRRRKLIAQNGSIPSRQDVNDRMRDEHIGTIIEFIDNFLKNLIYIKSLNVSIALCERTLGRYAYNDQNVEDNVEYMHSDRILDVLHQLIHENIQIGKHFSSKAEFSSYESQSIPCRSSIREIPWFPSDIDNNPLLSKELEYFTEYVSLTKEEKEMRLRIIEMIKNIVQSVLGSDYDVLCFGSLAVGLEIYQSDIDISVTYNPRQNCSKSSIDRLMTENQKQFNDEDECQWVIDTTGSNSDKNHRTVNDSFDVHENHQLILLNGEENLLSSDINDDEDNSSDEISDDDLDVNLTVNSFSFNRYSLNSIYSTASNNSYPLNIRSLSSSNRSMNNRDKSTLDTLHRLYANLKKQSWIERCEIRPKAKVPIINLIHKTLIEVDISIGMKSEDTTDIVKYFIESSDRLTRLHNHSSNRQSVFTQLVSFLKVLLTIHELDKPFSGGIGSYKLYGMIALIIRRFHSPTMTAGGYLRRFFEYFSDINNFNQNIRINIPGPIESSSYGTSISSSNEQPYTEDDLQRDLICIPSHIPTSYSNMKDIGYQYRSNCNTSTHQRRRNRIIQLVFDNCFKIHICREIFHKCYVTLQSRYEYLSNRLYGSRNELQVFQSTKKKGMNALHGRSDEIIADSPSSLSLILSGLELHHNRSESKYRCYLSYYKYSHTLQNDLSDYRCNQSTNVINNVIEHGNQSNWLNEILAGDVEEVNQRVDRLIGQLIKYLLLRDQNNNNPTQYDYYRQLITQEYIQSHYPHLYRSFIAIVMTGLHEKLLFNHRMDRYHIREISETCTNHQMIGICSELSPVNKNSNSIDANTGSGREVYPITSVSKQDGNMNNKKRKFDPSKMIHDLNQLTHMNEKKNQRMIINQSRSINKKTIDSNNNNSYQRSKKRKKYNKETNDEDILSVVGAEIKEYQRRQFKKSKTNKNPQPVIIPKSIALVSINKLDRQSKNPRRRRKPS